MLYSQFESRTQSIDLTSCLAGRNFFSEVFEIKNSEEFQHKFRTFITSRQFTNNFVFDCQLAEKSSRAGLMLVLAVEVNQLEKRDILIVNIRKNDY